MSTKKDQIWLIYDKDYEGVPKDVVLVSTSFQKVKSFLANKIKNENCTYRDSELSITKQLSEFKYDMRNKHRAIINDNLSSYYFTYWYDGEEM